MAYGQTKGWPDIYGQSSYNKDWKHISIPGLKEGGF